MALTFCVERVIHRLWRHFSKPPQKLAPAALPMLSIKYAFIHQIDACGNTLGIKEVGNGDEVSCADCGAVLPSEWAHQSVEHACTECGSVKSRVELSLTDSVEIEVHDGVRGKVIDKKFSSKKNPCIDFFHGDDLRKSDSKWMRKDRIIDKDRNLYGEKVVDPKTGEIVHYCEESLSEHVGHGSAKFKKDK